MDEAYEAKYRSRKNSFVVAGMPAIVFFIIGILGLAGSSPFSFILSLISFLISFGGIWILLKDYVDIYLYSDRMEVVSNTDGVLGKIYYSDISRVGFLHGHTQPFNTQGYDVKTYPADMLIIMLKDGEEFKLFSGEYEHLPEICAFIQEKVGQTS